MESKKYYIFWVCVYSLSYPACKVYAPYYIIVWVCHIFLHYLIKSMISRKKLANIKLCFDFLYYFFLKHFLF